MHDSVPCLLVAEDDSCIAGHGFAVPHVEREFAPRAKEVPVYATREEFREFKRSMQDLLKAFLDFFITFGLELGTGKSSKGLADLKSQLRATLED